MSKADFDEFVKRQQEEKNAFDSKKQLQEWIDFLNSLYSQIASYLQSYVEEKTAEIEFSSIQINEEFIGPYNARKMVIKIGSAIITFTPVGTMLIGSKGRVDVKGPAGTSRFVLVSKQASSPRDFIQITIRAADDPLVSPQSKKTISQIEWVWKIVTSPPEIKFIDLSEEAFFNMILSIANA